MFYGGTLYITHTSFFDLNCTELEQELGKACLHGFGVTGFQEEHGRYPLALKSAWLTLLYLV